MKHDRWSVWLAWFRYEDSDEAKQRPVLVLDDGTVFVLVAKMTSSKPALVTDYQLIEWEKAGLQRQTTVQLDKRRQMTESQLIHEIGRLSIIDIQNILQIIMR